MKCPNCNKVDSIVVDSRPIHNGISIRRRRECLNCDFRFTTYERVETIPITVLKRNGSRETFNRNKLVHGLSLACEKTSIQTSKLVSIVDELEVTLQQKNLREISSSDLGEMVLDQLSKLSEVAYIRFASVHREFRGITDFVEALEAINSNKNQLASVR